MRPGVSTDTAPALRALVATAQKLEEAGAMVLRSPAAEHVATCALLAADLIALSEAVTESFGLSPLDVKVCPSHHELVKLITEQR